MRKVDGNSEARGLGLAAATLLLWVLGLFYLASSHWLIFLARQPPLANLGDRVGSPARAEAGVVRIPGATGEPVVVRFPALGLAPESDYLLSLRAEPGASFLLQLVETRTGARVFEVRSRFRFEPRRHNLVLASRILPPHIRPQLRNEGPEEVVIRDFHYLELAAAHRWIRPAYRALGPLLLLALAWRRRPSLGRFLRRWAKAPEARRWDGFVAWTAFLVLVVAFHAAPVLQVMDTKHLSAVSQTFLESGRLSLPPDFAPATLEPLPYSLERFRGKTYHRFSSAPAILDVPFVAAFKLAGVASLGADGRFHRRHEESIFRMTAAVLAAALCSVLYLTARLSLAPLPSMGLTALFAFGTQIFSTVSRGYWSHGWAVLLLALALYLLLCPHLARRRWTYFAAATCLSWSFFCRPTMGLSILGIATWLFVNRRRWLASLAGASALWALVLMVGSKVAYGTLLPRYLWSGHVDTGAFWAASAQYVEAVLGTLVSPGRGLFVYVPIFAVILAAAAARWSRLESRGLAVVALAICGLHWQLVSSFRNWSGGQCFGPRLFSDLIPWFFLLAVLVLSAPASEVRRPRWSRWVVRTLVALAMATSLFINIRGATARATITWRTHYLPPPRIARIFANPGLWNWRYPQFMAGLLEPRRQEDRDGQQRRRDDRMTPAAKARR